MYKKSILDERKIRFIAGDICEDIQFTIDYLEASSVISYIDLCLYHYVHNSSGLMHKIKKDFITKKEELIKRIDALLLSYDVKKTKAYYYYVFRNIRSLFVDSYLYSDHIYDDFQTIMKNIFFVSFIKEYRKQKIALKDRFFCFLFLHKKAKAIGMLLKLFVRKHWN